MAFTVARVPSFVVISAILMFYGLSETYPMPEYKFEIYGTKDGKETVQVLNFFDAADDDEAAHHAERRLEASRPMLFRVTHQRLSSEKRVVFNRPI